MLRRRCVKRGWSVKKDHHHRHPVDTQIWGNVHNWCYRKEKRKWREGNNSWILSITSGDSWRQEEFFPSLVAHIKKKKREGEGGGRKRRRKNQRAICGGYNQYHLSKPLFLSHLISLVFYPCVYIPHSNPKCHRTFLSSPYFHSFSPSLPPHLI